MDLEYFKSHIMEELEGAKDYIIRAMELKPMNASWAKNLCEMSAQELSHASLLFNMFNEYCATLAANYSELPDYVRDIRDEITPKFMECSANIKHMHEQYNK